MADIKVEDLMRSIRERDLEGAAKQSDPSCSLVDSTAKPLSRLQTSLTITGRTHDQLPPVTTSRRGLLARVELWIKRQLKRATHWYTWEQVNFNFSVHHALRDLHTVLSAHEQELRKLHAQISESTEHDQYQATQLTELRAELEAERDQVAALVSELRERDERLQDEQRVCFKQVALETSEAAVLEDRARRKTEALLEELQRRISQLETDKK